MENHTRICTTPVARHRYHPPLRFGTRRMKLLVEPSAEFGGGKTLHKFHISPSQKTTEGDDSLKKNVCGMRSCQRAEVKFSFMIHLSIYVDMTSVIDRTYSTYHFSIVKDTHFRRQGNQKNPP